MLRDIFLGPLQSVQKTLSKCCKMRNFGRYFLAGSVLAGGIALYYVYKRRRSYANSEPPSSVEGPSNAIQEGQVNVSLTGDYPTVPSNEIAEGQSEVIISNSDEVPFKLIAESFYEMPSTNIAEGDSGHLSSHYASCIDMETFCNTRSVGSPTIAGDGWEVTKMSAEEQFVGSNSGENANEFLAYKLPSEELSCSDQPIVANEEDCHGTPEQEAIALIDSSTAAEASSVVENAIVVVEMMDSLISAVEANLRVEEEKSDLKEVKYEDFPLLQIDAEVMLMSNSSSGSVDMIDAYPDIDTQPLIATEPAHRKRKRFKKVRKFFKRLSCFR